MGRPTSDWSTTSRCLSWIRWTRRPSRRSCQNFTATTTEHLTLRQSLSFLRSATPVYKNHGFMEIFQVVYFVTNTVNILFAQNDRCSRKKCAKEFTLAEEVIYLSLCLTTNQRLQCQLQTRVVVSFHYILFCPCNISYCVKSTVY